MDVPLRQVPGRKCKVLFSYQPANDDELELQVGDIIDILSEVEEGWWRGKLNSQVGVFPSNFVAEVFEDAEVKEASHRKTSRSSVESDSSKHSNAHNSMNHDEPSESDVPELPPKPVKELCRVMYPYDAVNEDELTLREGDVITLVSRDGQDKGWWRGELNGKVGVFPDNFVTVITSDESKPARPPAKTNAATTNRAKDSITRPSASQPTALRKSTELQPKPVTDEKASPPGLSKKPVLPPPPLKKPQRSPSGASINKTLGSGLSQPDAKPNPTSPSKSDSQISTGAKIPLTSLTFSLKQALDTGKPTVVVKPDTDTQDGGCLSRSSGSFSPLSNHSSDTISEEKASGEVDLDCVGRSAMLTHPTASRVKAPRRRPPSGVVGTSKDGEETTQTLVNGNAETHTSLPDDKLNKAPWVEELKMNQARKQQSAQGRTRVMISSSSISSVGASTEPPTSLSPEPLKVSPGTVTLRSTSGNAAARPQSMFGGRSFSLSPSPSSPDTITVSHKQWLELNERVQRLEAKLDSEHEMFVKSLKEMANKLSEETEKRLQIQAELEKLATVLTQV